MKRFLFSLFFQTFFHTRPSYPLYPYLTVQPKKCLFMLVQIAIIIVGNNFFPAKFFDPRESTIKSLTRVKKYCKYIFKVSIRIVLLNRINSIGYSKLLSSYPHYKRRNVRIYYAAAHRARKAVDWHHSALDEIITGAICGGIWSRKGGVAQYKTRGGVGKAERRISREDIEWPSSKHVNLSSLRTPWNCETNDKTIKLYCTMFYIRISLVRARTAEDRVTSSKQTSAAVSFMGQSRVRFNFNSPRVISWAPACLSINLNYGAIKSS